jgi:hypothetical protein
VNGGDNLPAGVDEEKRETVGRADGEQVSGLVRHEGVSVGTAEITAPRNRVHAIRMDLVDRREQKPFGSQTGRGSRRGHDAAEIARLAGREAVDEPGKLAPPRISQRTGRAAARGHHFRLAGFAAAADGESLTTVAMRGLAWTGIEQASMILLEAANEARAHTRCIPGRRRARRGD